MQPATNGPVGDDVTLLSMRAIRLGGDATVEPEVRTNPLCAGPNQDPKGKNMRWWVATLCAGTLVVGGAALWRMRQKSTALPEWQRTLAAYPTPPLDGHVPYNDYAQRRFLWADVLRRESWGAEEVRTLAAVVDRQPIDFMFRDDAPLEQIKAHRAASEAIDVIQARFVSRAPIDVDAQDALVDVMLGHSKKADVWSRLQSTSALVYSGLVEIPRVRARLEVMCTDPHPDVAANARRQLHAYDERKARRDE